MRRIDRSLWRAGAAAVWAAAAALPVAGCSGSGNPDLNAATHTFYNAYCTRMRQCMGADSFDKMYGDGINACVEQSYREIRDLGALESGCSQEQWDQCANDLRQGTECTRCDADAGPNVCPSNSPPGPKIPASCQGC